MTDTKSRNASHMLIRRSYAVPYDACVMSWNHQTSFEVDLYDATFMKVPLSYVSSMSIMVHVGRSYLSLFVNLK